MVGNFDSEKNLIIFLVNRPSHSTVQHNLNVIAVMLFRRYFSFVVFFLLFGAISCFH